MRFIGSLEALLPALAAAAVLAALLSFGLTPLVRRWVSRLAMLDHPDARRVNATPVPRGGGLAVATAFTIVGLVGVGLPLLGKVPPGMFAFPAVSSTQVPALVALFVGGIAAAAIGALDDYLQLRARWQLIGQVARSWR